MNWVDFSKEHPVADKQVLVLFKSKMIMHCIFTGIQCAREYSTMDKIKIDNMTHWVYVDQLGLPKSDYEKLCESIKQGRDNFCPINGFRINDNGSHFTCDYFDAIKILINEIEKLKNK